MSSVDVYHYPHKKSEHNAPKKFSVDNANAFQSYIHRIFCDYDSIICKPDSEKKIKEAFNAFHKSDVSDWKKIVSAFAIMGTLILDEDRKKVRHALIAAEQELELPYSQLSGLALLLDVLPKGLIAVNGHSCFGCVLCEDRGNRTVWYSPKELLADRYRFARAVEIPKTWN